MTKTFKQQFLWKTDVKGLFLQNAATKNLLIRYIRANRFKVLSLIVAFLGELPIFLWKTVEQK